MKYRDNYPPWYRQQRQGYGPFQGPNRTRQQVEVPPRDGPQEAKVEPPRSEPREKQVEPQVPEVNAPVGEEKEWQEKALRLQAEMDNFRKRQARRADEAIAAERERLLSLFLPAVDNLKRALAQPQETNSALWQGVELTHREIIRRLEGEGVTRVETIGQKFDPELHEAVATIPAQAESGTIVKELEAGYKIGDKLLRPARVIVAA
jgi:molecular chaperone GrpE